MWSLHVPSRHSILNDLPVYYIYLCVWLCNRPASCPECTSPLAHSTLPSGSRFRRWIDGNHHPKTWLTDHIFISCFLKCYPAGVVKTIPIISEAAQLIKVNTFLWLCLTCSQHTAVAAPSSSFTSLSVFMLHSG